MFWRNPGVFVMGILNVTPDSFFDGGKYPKAEKARERALEMIRQGADVIDVGGESTRPGAQPVSVEEELRRVLPALQKIRKATSTPLSLDTSKAAVLEMALDIKAVDLLNDVTALRGDPEMVGVAAEAGIPVLLMHLRGTPATMQENPVYGDVVEEIIAFFKERIDFAASHGVAEEKIMLDPGIGFGKTLEHNLEILSRLDEICAMGYPVVIGPSRKSFIGAALGNLQEDRLVGTVTAVTAAILKGVKGIRVHDVKEMKQAATIAEKIKTVVRIT